MRFLAKDQYPIMRSFVCQCLFFSEFEKIVTGRIPGVIIMYVTSILETMVKEFMQVIYIRYR